MECSDWAWNTEFDVYHPYSCLRPREAGDWTLECPGHCFPTATKGIKIVYISFPPLKSHANTSSGRISFAYRILVARMGDAIFSFTTVQYKNAYEKKVGVNVHCQLSTFDPGRGDIPSIFYLFLRLAVLLH